MYLGRSARTGVRRLSGDFHCVLWVGYTAGREKAGLPLLPCGVCRLLGCSGEFTICPSGFKLYLGGVVTLSGWVYRYARAGFDAASMQDLSMPPGVNCRYACTEGNAALRRFPLRSAGRLYRGGKKQDCRCSLAGFAAAPAQRFSRRSSVIKRYF